MGRVVEGPRQLPGLAQQYLGPYSGNTLSTQLPFLLFVVIAAAVTLAAFVKPGREGLARIGVASVVVSLSTHAHAFMTGLPSMLQLRTTLFWFAIGIMSTPMRAWWWLAICLAIASWFIPQLRRPISGDTVAHPLGSRVEPWPDSFGPQGAVPGRATNSLERGSPVSVR